MADRYKVWIQIERIGDETPDGENIGEEEDFGGREFETLELAQEFVALLERGEKKKNQ